MLIFQTDTILRKDTVDDFLQYDYVGAPWAQPDLRWFGCLEVGNGGLSLRRVDAMLEIVTRFPSRGGNEDGYFSLMCLKHGYKVPSISEAQKFAVETIFYEDPCGLHKPHLGRLPSDALKQLLGS